MAANRAARTAKIPTRDGRAGGHDAVMARPRPHAPEPPAGEITLESPPGLVRGNPQAMMHLLFMVPMMLGMGGMSFVYIGRNGGVMTYLFGGLFLLVMIGMVTMALAGGRHATKARINEERRDYQRYLAGLRKQVYDVAERQRLATGFAQPDPADLWAFAGAQEGWERRRSDPVFGQVRIGSGPQRLATPLRPPHTAPLEDLDPVSATSLRHFIRAYSTVPRMPVAISLRAFARIGVSGPREPVLDLVRAMLAQAATFHAAADLRIGLCVAKDRAADWEWLKWLPHAAHASDADAVGPVRLVGGNLDTVAELFDSELGTNLAGRPPFTRQGGMGFDAPHLVIVVDGGRTHGSTRIPAGTGLHGVTILDLTMSAPAEPAPNGLFLHLDQGRLGMLVESGDTVRLGFLGTPDVLDTAGAEAVARGLAPRFRSAGPAPENPLASTFGLPGLLGLGDPRDTDPAITWRPRSARERLRVPLGLDLHGQPTELDLKESAENGMGPHGLVIGATGSGKSELLRTLVTGLAVTHSSETLNLALIDFKGGATFAGMTDLPHTCAVITNLSEELPLVDRMADALNGELVRRQELLRAAGNYASVRDYERARAAGADLAPVPALLVIIDEFSELLSARPEFIDLFVQIGRLGRSLAVHLLLASQRLEEGRLRGLEAHLSYRIALRTFSASESRAVLGVQDAYQLPAVPGSAYLKIDTDTLLRLKTAYVSGELPPRANGDDTVVSPGSEVLAFTLAPAPVPPRPAATAVSSDPPKGTGETIMGAMLGALIGKGPAAHQIWLPPLAEPPTLDQLLPPLAVDPQRGLCPAGWAGNGKLVVPAAMVDKPFEQRRDPLWLDLTAAAGNVMLIGAPQSGKSTFLRGLVSSLALTHTPAEVQFFLLDMGGGALGQVAELPHVSGHAVRSDVESCRRIVAEVASLLTARELLFAQARIDSVAAFRQRRAGIREDTEGGREFGDVFLVIDDWAVVRQEFDYLEPTIIRLAQRGLGFGIHVVASTTWWLNMGTPLRDSLGTRVELRLGDPGDSMIDRRAAQNVPASRPGRGINQEKLHILGALPRVDGDQRVDTLGAGTKDMVSRINAAWQGPPAPPLRLLPRTVPLESLGGTTGVPLGLAETDLKPVALDFANEPHFLAFADVESGKTALLRAIAKGVTQRYTPAQARVILVDYRRGLLGAVGEEHLLGYAGSEPVLTDLVAQIATAMRDRLPGPNVTADQLRRRNWWQGRELYLLVDDYELVATPGKLVHPFAPLLEYLPHARDIGLHMIVTRGVGGAARGMFDPVIQRLRELGSPGLIMSGTRDEGVLLGDVRPSPQPPGRGTLIRRRGTPVMVQVGWTPPVE